jgi:hypothetical protein
VQRGAILKGEVGIGKKAKDLSFEDARKKFEDRATASKKAGTARVYKENLRRLGESFSGKRLSQISSFHIEATNSGASLRVRASLPIVSWRS